MRMAKHASTCKVPGTLLFLCALMVIMNAVDLMTTHAALQYGGVEANPIFASFNTHGITIQDILFKIGIFTGFSLLIIWLHVKTNGYASTISYLLAFVVVALFAVVSISNVNVALTLM